MTWKHQWGLQNCRRRDFKKVTRPLYSANTQHRNMHQLLVMISGVTDFIPQAHTKTCISVFWAQVRCKQLINTLLHYISRTKQSLKGSWRRNVGIPSKTLLFLTNLPAQGSGSERTGSWRGNWACTQQGMDVRHWPQCLYIQCQLDIGHNACRYTVSVRHWPQCLEIHSVSS